MKKPLSKSQREIMEVIWQHGELSAAEIRSHLAEAKRSIARETVRTLLTRMEAKGWLFHRVVGRTYLYSAAIPREKSLGQQAMHLVDTIFGGSAESLMSALMDERPLTSEEAEKIAKMIQTAKENAPRKPSSSGKKTARRRQKHD